MFKLFSRAAKPAPQITLEPLGETFAAAAGETLLQAALNAGIAYPHNCRVGSCATCKCRLVSGKVRELADFSYTLSKDELASGHILACQSVPQGDVRVMVNQLPTGARAHVKTIAGRVAAVRRLAPRIFELTIELPEPMTYRAGQFANLSIPGLVGTRSYSFADAPSIPSQTRFRFHVRHIPSGVFSTWLADTCQAGCEIGVCGPFGNFGLHDGDGPIICVAGGTGMAPIKAILEEALARGFNRQVVFLYGARTAADLYCISEIEALRLHWQGRFTFIPVLSEEPQDSTWPGARGFATDLIAAQDLPFAESDAYLCGPPPMVDAAVAALRACGVREQRIHFDKFFDLSNAPSAAAA